MADACPLCGRDKYMHKAKKLYGQLVCRKCYYGFANRRQAAFIIDVLIRAALAFPLGLGIGIIGQATQNASLTTGLLVFGLFVLDMAFGAKDGFDGRSAGKYICGLQVVDQTTGAPIGFRQSLLRNTILVVTAVAYDFTGVLVKQPLIPMLVLLVDLVVLLVMASQLQKGFRWGDRSAGTKVIWLKYADYPVFAVAGAGAPPPLPVNVPIRPAVETGNPFQPPTN
ncbi:MAG TPA: RDD family protein [Pirellulales bacterium]|jgi:uncharacterized RDD family membrane protein YckC|nr:RDD family protein [Pirellulales bacterium]